MTEPLKAYGPDNEIIALSYDGGARWAPVAVKGTPKPVLRQYTRRIAAVLPEGGPTPAWERRIVTSFAPLQDAGILAGWGPLSAILALDEAALDGIVVPFGAIAGEPAEVKAIMTELRRVAKTLFVDIDAPTVVDRALFPQLVEVVQNADAIIVPADIIAMGLRKFNANTFCVPPTINPEHWRGARRVAPAGTIRLAVQPTTDRFVTESVAWALERWEGRAVSTLDDWAARSPGDDPAFYTSVDIVVVGPPAHRQQFTNAALLAPMMAGCMVIVDGAYVRTVIHGHSGSLVTAKGPSPWRKELTHAITDGRTRTKMQAGARKRAEGLVNRTMLSRLALPYRVMLPER